MRTVTVIIMLFLLACAALAGTMFHELPEYNDAKLDRICDQLRSQEVQPWHTPPQEVNHVWIAKNKAQRATCKTRKSR